MKKPLSLLGIDIRQNFIRLIAISYLNGSYQVEACIVAKLDAKDLSDKVIVRTLRKLLEQIPSRIRGVVVALSHSEVIFKEVEVDSGLTAEETLDFLRFKIAEYVGIPDDNSYFDYYPLSEGSKYNGAPKIFKLIAAQQESVKKWLKLLQAVNLKPRIIDVDIYALERAVRQQLKTITGVVAVINIDCGDILIVVIDQEKIVYQYAEDVGSENLDSIAQVIEQLCLKLQLIYSTILQPVSCVVLGGEKAIFPGLVQEANIQLNIPVVIANPFLGMLFSSGVDQDSMRDVAHLMLIGCGLALRVANDC